MKKDYHKTNTGFLRELFKTASVQYLFTASNAPHRALAVSNKSGNYQLHAVDFETGFVRQATNAPHGALFGSISPDGEYIYILKDQDGNEYGHFVRVPFNGGDEIDITPNVPPYFSYSVSTSDDNNTICFTATLEKKNKVLIVPCHQNTFKPPKEIYSTDTALSEPICSPDGKYVCVAETSNSTGKSTLLLIANNAGNNQPKRSRAFNTITPLAFSHIKDSPTVFALARQNGWCRPIWYDFSRKHVSEISHPLFLGDVWAIRLDEKNETALLCDTYQAQQTLYIYNLKTRHIKRVGPKDGNFNFHFNSAAALKDYSFVVKWHNFNKSPRLLKLKPPKYDTWNELRNWSGNISTNYHFESVKFRSSDGETVQMWIARPRNAKKPIPFVIDVHGGPHGVVGDEYSPEAHAWLKAGFGYCTVNYRGSIGFGKKFEQKIYGNPGRWEVEDIAAARNWLTKKQYANPKQIVLYGWSWGGYVALLALGRYPSLWNCCIAGAAITNCVMQYEDEPAYFKAEDQKRFKGTPETVRAKYIRSSPSTYANNIKAPIFIMHGRNDTRCPPRQIKYFEELLKKAGKKITIEWFLSGHTGDFTDTILRISLIKKSIEFAARNIFDNKKTATQDKDPE